MVRWSTKQQQRQQASLGQWQGDAAGLIVTAAGQRDRQAGRLSSRGVVGQLDQTAWEQHVHLCCCCGSRPINTLPAVL